MNGIYFLLLFEIVLLLVSFVMSQRDIMSPSTMICIMFTISTIFAMLNIDRWGINYGFDSTVILLTGIMVFSVVAAMPAYIRVKLKIGNNPKMNLVEVDHEVFEISTIRLILFLMYNLVIVAWYFVEVRNAVGLFSGGIAGIFISYRKMGINNLAGLADNELVGGIINQFLKVTIASGYVSTYIIIYEKVFSLKKKRIDSILLILIILTSLVPSIMIASRSNFLKFISAALIEFYILWNQKYNWERNVSLKFVWYGIVILVVGIPIFYYSLRFIGREATQGIIDYTSEYVGSSIKLFDMYVRQPVPASQFGEESLVGVRKVLNALGIGEASLSSNLEFRNYGNGISNVYTFFRRPLHDFGIGGMYIFTAIVASVFGNIYYKHIRRQEYTHQWNYWVLLYGYLFYWIISSSILQYSGSYISVGTLMYIIVILLCFNVMTKRRIKMGISTIHNIDFTQLKNE